MNDKYQIAIPSSNRIKTLQQKTLAYLSNTNIDLKKVNIHVRGQEQYHEYKKELDPKTYGKIIMFDDLIGVKYARNNIAAHYPKGTKLVCIDDDIISIEERVDKKTLKPVDDLLAIINYGFLQSELLGYRLWGIHYTRNAFYMEKDMRVNLCIIAGGFFGFVVQKNAIEYVSIDDYEDIERSFKYYKEDNGLIRLDKYTTHTNSRKEKGGMQDYRNWNTYHKSAEYLAKKYPQYCDYRIGKDGLPCVKVKDKSQIRRRSVL